MSTVLSDEEIVKYLLFQQFYYGGNLIYGRTREVSVKIQGSGPIIERFYNCLISDIDLIREKRYLDYLDKFNIIIFPIDTKSILEKVQNNFENLEEEQLTPQIITSILIGEMLMHIRKLCFAESLAEMRQILIEKVKKFNKKIIKIEGKFTENVINITDNFIEEKMDNLKRLFSLNDGDIGLIYNLSFLKKIAFKLEKNKKMKVYRTILKALQKYMKKVAEKIY